MDRSPPTHWQGPPFEPTRTQHIPTRRQTIASYRPTLPSESRMPDEWGYPSSSMPHVSNMPNNVQGVVPQPIASGSALRGAPPQALHPTAAAVPTLPTCRYPNCGRPVTRDEVSHELTEYCSPEHMRDAVQRLGYPVCPACNRCPRRSDSKFCGSLCEEWAMQQQQQQQQQHQHQRQQQHQHQQQLQSQQRQQHHQQLQQLQRWQSPNMGPSPTAPYPNAVPLGNGVRRASLSYKKGIWKQVRFQQ